MYWGVGWAKTTAEDLYVVRLSDAVKFLGMP
jgi:hypothetical protein